MKITVKIKLLPTYTQKTLINQTLKEYIKAVNSVLADYKQADACLYYSSTQVLFNLPSALCAQVAQDSNSIFKKYIKDCKSAKKNQEKNPDIEVKEVKLPVLKKEKAIWNNQNYTVTETHLRFPVLIDGKCRRISVKALVPKETYELITKSKLGTLRLTYKNRKLVAQIAIEAEEVKSTGENTMGVDLGQKIPAVALTSTGKVKFFRKGRQNKYLRRKYKAKRKKLGKEKKLNAIKRINDKEQRVMKDIDHKTSREIVNFAEANGVKVIKLEKLANIRKRAKASQKNKGYNQYDWTYYRVMEYINYKAKLLGIEVETVNPAYTSQECPSCGKRNIAKDRSYVCSCGYRGHRDIVGASNILKKAPEVSGKRERA